MSGGGGNDIKIVYISKFSNFGHRKSIFSQIQNSPNYPRGGQENYGLFPQFGTFLGARAPIEIARVFWPDTCYLTLVTQYSMPVTQYLLLNMCYSILICYLIVVAWYLLLTLDIWYLLLDTQWSLCETCYSILVTGYLLLELVTGYL